MTKYVLIVDFQPGVAETPIEEWQPQEVQAHLDYYARLRREVPYGRASRIDVLLEDAARGRCYVEVKSTTYARGNVALFPDAPTERGRTVPGVQGVDRRLPDRRRRHRGTRDRDRGEDLGGAGPGRHIHPAADPGPPDHGALAPHDV